MFPFVLDRRHFQRKILNLQKIHHQSAKTNCIGLGCNGENSWIVVDSLQQREKRSCRFRLKAGGEKILVDIGHRDSFAGTI
jgi:hypothetical protein